MVMSPTVVTRQGECGGDLTGCGDVAGERGRRGGGESVTAFDVVAVARVVG